MKRGEKVADKDSISWDVVPLRRIGPIRLGMQRDQVLSLLKMKPIIIDLTRYLYGDGVELEYSDEGKVIFIQLSSIGALRPYYRGKDVFHTAATDLVDFVSQDAAYDRDHWELGYTFVFPDLELCLWRSVIPESEDDPEGRYFETIGIARKGDWSE